MSETADYIVVGAGSVGTVVAARLAEAGAKVTLLEAGAQAHQVAVRVPALYMNLMDSAELSLEVGDGEIGWHIKALLTRRSSR